MLSAGHWCFAAQELARSPMVGSALEAFGVPMTLRKSLMEQYPPVFCTFALSQQFSKLGAGADLWISPAAGRLRLAGPASGAGAAALAAIVRTGS